jgi:transcriptional regulator GlxA family with amidase domain
VHDVVALVLPSVVAFDLSIPAQVFGHPDAAGQYRFAVCARRPGLVPSTTGFDVSVGAGLDLLERADTVVVPGYLPMTDPPADVVAALRAAHRRGARIASVCVGTFALAAAGLLDGRTATTHWQHAEEFRRRFPAVDLRPEVLYVDEGQVLSSAGIAAGIDLCLHMVRHDYGAREAARTSRRMVAALYRDGGQAQFIEHPVPADTSLLAATCAWAVAELHRPLTVPDLAAHAGYSVRSFSRQFQAHYGTTPARWLAGQRILQARRLLEETDLPVDDVAWRSGLGTAANLRARFARAVSTTPSQYRKAFRGNSPSLAERPVASPASSAGPRPCGRAASRARAAAAGRPGAVP